MSMVEPGTILLGKYRIEHVLAKGGMGVVARAHHLQLDVPVAIKFLLADVLEQDDVVQRFRREAQAAVKLRGEHVCRIIDVGTLENGAPYMVMEHLEGTDLKELLRERGRLDFGFAVDLVLQACEALAEAHACGIVHRDVKPANLFLTQGADGEPLLKLLDFGVSKVSSPVTKGITKSQVIIGTPAYMSPEQVDSSKDVDARTDIWALGVVLYELLCGQRPFRGLGFAGLAIALPEQPVRPLEGVEVPDGLERAIACCLRIDPAQRFRNMAELAMALAPYAATTIQAARSTERTARVLGLSSASAISQELRARMVAPVALVDLTLRETQGERLPPARPGSGKDIAAPRRWRGVVIAVTAATVLGMAASLAVVLRVDIAGIGRPAAALPAPGAAPAPSAGTPRQPLPTIAQPLAATDAGTAPAPADSHGAHPAEAPVASAELADEAGAPAGATPQAKPGAAPRKPAAARDPRRRRKSTTEAAPGTTRRATEPERRASPDDRKLEDAFGTRN
jgi:hypothetical protein